MKVEYGALPLDVLKKEHRRLHRKLTLPNLFIFIISVIAAASLVLGALFSINVHIDRELVNTVVDLAEENSSSENTDSQTGGMSQTDTIAFLMRDVQMDVAVSLYPLDVVAVALSGTREDVKQLIEKSIPDLEELVEELSDQMAPAMVSLAMMQAVEELPEGLVPEDIDTTVFNETIKLINEQDPDAAKAAFMTASETFAAEQLNITLTDADRDAISQGFDDALELMRGEDGTYSISNLVYAILEEMNNGSQGGSGTASVASMNRNESAADLLPEAADGTVSGGQDGTGTGTGEGTQSDQIDTILALLDDPTSIVDGMDEATLQTIRMVCMGVTALVFLCAGCWALLALFALLHMLLRNKKVGMWYVKLRALLPFLLFFLLPMLAIRFLPRFIPQIPAAFTSLPIAFGGLTFVSAICLLVLWIISIFWCHPIKKQIKQCKYMLRMKERYGDAMQANAQ